MLHYWVVSSVDVSFQQVPNDIYLTSVLNRVIDIEISCYDGAQEYVNVCGVPRRGWLH